MEIHASDLEPELSNAAKSLVDSYIKANLHGYTPTHSDWPWHVEKKPPEPRPDAYTPSYYDISGSPSPLSVNTDAKTISFTFTVIVTESGGGASGN